MPAAIALLALGLAAGATLLAGAGCGSRDENRMRLEVVDADGLEAFLKRYEGRVVLADFWATWCAPCVAAFPRLCAWQEKYGPEGLTILTISIDAPEIRTKKVEPFLARQCAGLEGVMLDPRFVGELSDRWSRRWRTEVPARFLFDRRGELIGEYLADVPSGEIEGAIQEALGL